MCVMMKVDSVLLTSPTVEIFPSKCINQYRLFLAIYPHNGSWLCINNGCNSNDLKSKCNHQHQAEDEQLRSKVRLGYYNVIIYSINRKRT